MKILQLFGLSGTRGDSSMPARVGMKFSTFPGFEAGLGERSFVGDLDPGGSGISAGIKVSPSFSLALSWFGLVCRDLEGLAEILN